MNKELVDADTTIQEVKDRVRSFVHERDWEKYHKPKDLAISICLEAAELLELFQWKSEDEIRELLENSERFRKRIEEELADVLIYAFSFSNVLNIEVANIINTKIKINERKYPVERYYGRFIKDQDNQ